MDSSIERFEEMVLNSARRRRDEALSAVNDKKNAAVADECRRIKENYEKRLVYGKEALKKKYNKDISEKMTQYKKEYLDRRGKLIEEIFSGAAEEVLKYMQTPQYAERYEKYISDIAANGRYSAEINKGDAAMEQLLTKHGIPFTCSNTDIIGGLKLENIESNISCDLTYAAKFEEIRKKFYSGKYK